MVLYIDPGTGGVIVNFLIAIMTVAGAPKYIPKFNVITDNPILKTSDSDSAFSIKDNVEIIGVIASLTASLNKGCSLSMSAIVGLKE